MPLTFGFPLFSEVGGFKSFGLCCLCCLFGCVLVLAVSPVRPLLFRGGGKIRLDPSRVSSAADVQSLPVTATNTTRQPRESKKYDAIGPQRLQVKSLARARPLYEASERRRARCRHRVAGQQPKLRWQQPRLARRRTQSQGCQSRRFSAPKSGCPRQSLVVFRAKVW